MLVLGLSAFAATCKNGSVMISQAPSDTTQLPDEPFVKKKFSVISK